LISCLPSGWLLSLFFPCLGPFLALSFISLW
jgi:hypothetical protein